MNIFTSKRENKRACRVYRPGPPTKEICALGTFAMVNSLQDFDIQHNEAPELVEFEVHPELIFGCDFHFEPPVLLRDDFPAGQCP
jgi:hypothetical protein